MTTSKWIDFTHIFTGFFTLTNEYFLDDKLKYSNIVTIFAHQATQKDKSLLFLDYSNYLMNKDFLFKFAGQMTSHKRIVISLINPYHSFR